MKRQLHVSLLVASLFAMASVQATEPAKAAEPTKAAAPAKTTPPSVNGKQISQITIDGLTAAQVAQGRPDTPELRKAVTTQLVQREVIAQEAQKTGVAKKADVLAQMTMAQQSVLVSAYLQDYVQSHPVADSTIKAEYDKARATLGDKEYNARHILVDNEDEAKAIIAKLKGGAKFEDLAKESSKDPGSKEKGGDLGWSNKASYVKPFADAMIALGKGKFTETPVKSDFGWHIIELVDTRDLAAPSFEEAKPRIAQHVQQQMIEKHIADLVAKAKIK